MPQKKTTALVRILSRTRKSAAPKKRRMATKKVAESQREVPRQSTNVVLAPSTNIYIPGHGVSGYPTLGLPSNYGYYTGAGAMVTPVTGSASRYGVQTHQPVAQNTFTTSTHVPAPFTPTPNVASNYAEPTVVATQEATFEASLPGISHSLQTQSAPGVTSIRNRFRDGFGQDDRVAQRLVFDNLNESNTNINTPAFTPLNVNTTPSQFITPEPRVGFLNDQGTVNAPTRTYGPSTTNSHHIMEAPNRIDVINTSNTGSGVHPSMATVGQQFNGMGITQLLNALSAPPPLGPSADIPIQPTGGTGQIRSTSARSTPMFGNRQTQFRL